MSASSECIKPLAQEKDEDDEKLAGEMQKKSQEMLRSLQKNQG